MFIPPVAVATSTFGVPRRPICGFVSDVRRRQLSAVLAIDPRGDRDRVAVHAHRLDKAEPPWTRGASKTGSPSVAHPFFGSTSRRMNGTSRPSQVRQIGQSGWRVMWAAQTFRLHPGHRQRGIPQHRRRSGVAQIAGTARRSFFVRIGSSLPPWRARSNARMGLCDRRQRLVRGEQTARGHADVTTASRSRRAVRDAE